MRGRLLVSMSCHELQCPSMTSKCTKDVKPVSGKDGTGTSSLNLVQADIAIDPTLCL
jgi:hypothetical protein